MNSPVITVGMPVFNGERFLESAIESVLNQTMTDFELIISDNCSADATEAICRRYARQDSRIRYIRQSTNIGASPNFECVLKLATGKYFMWTACDDLNESRFIQVLYEALEQYPDVVLAMTDVRRIDESNALIDVKCLDNIRAADALSQWSSCRRLFFENPTSQIFFAIYGLYRTEILRQTQLNFRDRVKYASGCEIPLLAQVALLGKIISVPQPLKSWRRHGESTYHSEQKKNGPWQRVDNHLNISRCLLAIVHESSLSMYEKTRLRMSILGKSSRYLSHSFTKGLVKNLIRRQK